MSTKKPVKKVDKTVKTAVKKLKEKKGKGKK